MKTLNDEIDTAAEVDNGYFWKRVNRRKSGQSSVGSQIMFGDTTAAFQIFYRYRFLS